jgi:hypothetical protein
MNRRLITEIMLLMLPALAVQVRFLIFRRERYGSLIEGAGDLLRAVPHDLCIMGMTLGAASIPLGPSALPESVYSFNIVGIVGAFLPLYIAAFVSIVQNKALRISLGILAYLVGAGIYLVASSYDFVEAVRHQFG